MSVKFVLVKRTLIHVSISVNSLPRPIPLIIYPQPLFKSARKLSFINQNTSEAVKLAEIVQLSGANALAAISEALNVIVKGKTGLVLAVGGKTAEIT